MRYFLHTTTMAQRLAIFGTPSVIKEIKIDDFLGTTLALNENEKNNELYLVSYEPMLETLKEFDKGEIEPEETTYYKRWAEIKGVDSCRNRVRGFKELYDSIKRDGLKEPIAVTQCGQKLDGSHRAAIMKHLGQSTIKAREYTINWRQIDAQFLVRTAYAREKLYGRNYYYIDFGFFKNIEESPVYKENSYDRWEILRGLVQGSVLDVGCNEGFVSIMSALAGHTVTSYDHEFIEGANFHKLAFEFKHERQLPVTFHEQDITNAEIGQFDTALLLNVIYHIKEQEKVMEKLRKSCKRLIMQGNLRKAHEVEKFNGCTIETMKRMCEESGWKVERVIEWRDKPIIVCV